MVGIISKLIKNLHDFFLYFNCLFVLGTACLLQLTEVVNACCAFLKKQLHPSNCIGIRLFADSQGCVDLLNVSHDYTSVITYTIRYLHCQVRYLSKNALYFYLGYWHMGQSVPYDSVYCLSWTYLTWYNVCQSIYLVYYIITAT